jgi:isopentenyl-diphosphate delta-isomerase
MEYLNPSLSSLSDFDPTAVSRKRDHIELAFRSQVTNIDPRFYYEPLFSAHPERGSLKAFDFLGKVFRVPLWVSSMTGGTQKARVINQNLARACRDFGFGMGLGSCRQLLYADEYLADFSIRPILGDAVPLFANLGIAQLEHLIEQKELFLTSKLVEKLQADGLIIHVNPLQEWLQPEGDRFKRPPIATIETVLAYADFPIIVKEVGQGFGYQSLTHLLQLPLAAIDFAAAGGTNFAKLELLRGGKLAAEAFETVTQIGHHATDMVDMTNAIIAKLGDNVKCKQVIISGGIKNFLDGFYLRKKLNLPSVYGQASSFLKYAQEDYTTLYEYVDTQIRGLELAEAYLVVRP